MDSGPVSSAIPDPRAQGRVGRGCGGKKSCGRLWRLCPHPWGGATVSGGTRGAEALAACGSVWPAGRGWTLVG